MSVYPDHTFTPSLHIQEGITCLVQMEGGFIVGRAVYRFTRLVVFLTDKFIERRQVIYRPVFQFLCLVTIDHFHLLGDTFPVVDRLVKIHTPHGFYQDVQLSSFLQGFFQRQGKFTVTTIQTSQQFTVGKHLCPVVDFVNM